MSDAPASLLAAMNVKNHPLVHTAQGRPEEVPSRVERLCQRIAAATGSPLALALAVAVQAVWIPLGLFTHLDPYPFAFLLTCSNVIQLILIFVLAVGQRQASGHAEMRAQHDHEAISRLLYHQELQEQVLIALARKLQIEVHSLEKAVRQLAEEGD